MACRLDGAKPLSEPMLEYCYFDPKGTFTHAQSGRRRKIGFNTNHYMRSQIRGRRVEAKSAPQQMGPTPNFPRPLRNRTLQTISVLKKWQIRPRPHSVCVNIPAVAERRCQNRPVCAPQPLRACVNVALGKNFKENAFENVVRKMAAILSRPQCLNVESTMWKQCLCWTHYAGALLPSTDWPRLSWWLLMSWRQMATAMLTGLWL